MRYKISPIATLALEEIFYYGLLEFGPIQANKYQEAIHQTFDLLAFMPKVGRPSERHPDNQYRFPHGSHVIYYHVEQDNIIIDDIVLSVQVTSLWPDEK